MHLQSLGLDTSTKANGAVGYHVGIRSSRREDLVSLVHSKSTFKHGDGLFRFGANIHQYYIVVLFLQFHQLLRRNHVDTREHGLDLPKDAVAFLVILRYSWGRMLAG